MVLLLAIVWHLSAHGVFAQIANFDQGDQSCRDLSHCRSIWDIIWSCLVIIFACTWVAIHPDIPTQPRGQWQKFWESVLYFIGALIVPEAIIVEAWIERFQAQELAKKYQDHKWTLTHGFFVMMGGFVMQDRDTKKYRILKPEEIEHYLHIGQITISEEEIQDKSKGDALSKGLVVVQTSWFILQIVARAAEHLPVTELEIATLAFAVLNCATYALWWNKPLSIECPIIVAEMLEDAEAGNKENDSDEFIEDNHRQNPSLSGTVRVDRMPSSRYFLILAILGALFGGVHCIAWSFHYPTAPEMLAWKISSIITTVLPVIFSASFMLGFITFTLGATGKVTRLGGITHWVSIVVPGIVIVPYFLARLALLVLALTTLRSLPPDAYTTVHWTTFIPHI